MKLTRDDVAPYFGARATAVEPVTWGVLKLVWADGAEGVVDLRPLLKRGEMFAFLRDEPRHFFQVGNDQGRRIFWTSPDGTEADLGTDQIRAWSEMQAALVDSAA